MKILFLDIDGVCNSSETFQRHSGVIGIDPYMALLVDRIIQATDCKVVLSSSWKHSQEGRDEVRRQVCDFIDITPNLDSGIRGKEIEAWLSAHPEVKQYAILDDDSDMLPEQMDNFFQTKWDKGLTQDIANKVIQFLSRPPANEK